MATVRIEYFGMSGEGRTVTEAKKDAGRKIETALTGTWTPEILTWRGYAIIVYREPRGWCYHIIADSEDGIRAGRVWDYPNHKTRDEAIDAAKCHLADIGWVEQDGEIPPDFLTDRNAIENFRSMARWRQRYHFARRRGFSDHDAHSYAGFNPSRPELIAQVESAPEVAEVVPRPDVAEVA